MKIIPNKQLMKEAIVVGVFLVILFFYSALSSNEDMYGDKAMTVHIILAVQLFIAGFIFHVICEYTGVNHWYCSNR